MGPVWHGGQDIKALVLASRAEAAAKSLGWAAPFPTAAWLRAERDVVACHHIALDTGPGLSGLGGVFEGDGLVAASVDTASAGQAEVAQCL